MLLVPYVRGNTRPLGFVAIIGLVTTGLTMIRPWGIWSVAGTQLTAGGLVRVDGFGLFFSAILLIVALLVLVVLFHMLRVFLTGGFHGPRQFN